MGKEAFLAALESRLSGLPREDAAERLSFYGEMIDDRIEEGCSETEAVAGLGPIDRIVSQILSEIPLKKLMQERIAQKPSLQGWEIVLLVLGFPLWFSLLIAGFLLLFSVYVLIWIVDVALWTILAACFVSAFAGAGVGIAKIFRGEHTEGLLLISAGLVLAGLSILLFYGCTAVTKGAVRLTRTMTGGVKSLFLRKERVK